jgi:hypothetical protein
MRAGTERRTGMRRALLGAALAVAALGAAPGSAHAWTLTTQMFGGGNVHEKTPRNLYGDAGCTSNSAVASGAFSGNCVAGTPNGVYNSGDIVEIEARIPAALAA